MVLQEFLVALGFKVDEDQFRAVERIIKKTQGVLEDLGEGVAAVAILVDRNVIQMAEKFDTLYYSAQRMNTTVRNLQSFQYAAKMIGVDLPAANAAIEGMSRAIRLNPGLNGFLKQLGVQPGRDTITELTELLPKLQHMAPAMAAQYGQQFGIDPDTLNMLLKNPKLLQDAMAERQRMFRNAGLDPDAVAKRSAEFEREMLRFDTDVDILKSLLAERFLPAVDMLVKGLSYLVDRFDRLDKLTHGGSTYALAGLGIATVGAGLMKKLAGAGLRSLGRAMGVSGEGAVAGEAAGGAEVGGVAAAEGGGAAALAEFIVPVVLAVLGILGLLEAWKKWSQPADDALSGFRKWIYGGTDPAHGQGGQALWHRMAHATESASAATVAYFKGMDIHNPGNLRNWAGRPQIDRGKSGRFATFDSDEQGLEAMASNLIAYGNHHRDTIRKIVSAWAPAKDHNNTEAYIASTARDMHLSADARLNLRDPAVLAALMRNIVRSEGEHSKFGDEALRSAAMASLSHNLGSAGGSRSVTIHQHIETNVHGTSDANGTARHVVREQRQQIADLTRNATGALAQ